MRQSGEDIKRALIGIVTRSAGIRVWTLIGITARAVRHSHKDSGEDSNRGSNRDCPKERCEASS